MKNLIFNVNSFCGIFHSNLCPFFLNRIVILNVAALFKVEIMIEDNTQRNKWNIKQVLRPKDRTKGEV